MNYGRYLSILAIFLMVGLVVQPALSVEDLTDVVTGNPAENVTRIVTNYTADLEGDAANKYYNYGVQSLHVGDHINAIKYFDQALAENTTMIKKTDAILYLYQNKAYSLIQLERYNEAVTTVDAGLVLYPKDPMLWNNRGYALSLLGKPQDALRSYDTAISFDRNYTNAYINRGNLLSKMGKYSDAVDAYTRANETDPFNIAASDGLEAAKIGEAGSNRTMTIVLVIVLIAAAGIVIWYVRFRKPGEPAPEGKKKKAGKK